MAYQYALRDPEFVFYSAHFIILPKEREFLHGHTYRAEAMICSQQELGVETVERVKEALKHICKELSHKFLLPAKSEYMQVVPLDPENYQISLWGKPTYVLPKGVCLSLPISYSSAELLAEYIIHRIQSMGILTKATVEVVVFERDGQAATCRL